MRTLFPFRVLRLSGCLLYLSGCELCLLGCEKGEETTNPSSAGGGVNATVCPDGPLAAEPFLENRVANVVGDGFRFTEGPVWVSELGALLFSDFLMQGDQLFPSNIHRFVPGQDGFEVFIQDSGSNGLGIALDGRLLACDHTRQEVALFDLSSKVRSTLVADYMGSRFSSPNDIAVRRDGNLYFTDPDWQLGARTQELPQAAYRRAPDGTLSVIEQLNRPNGISLSPDQNVLYVSNTQVVRAYDVLSDGTTANGRDFVDSSSDGMAVDCAGNLYLTTGGNVEVYAPDAAHLGTIEVGRGTTNVAFGGAQRTTLFITAGSRLYSIELAIPGFPF